MRINYEILPANFDYDDTKIQIADEVISLIGNDTTNPLLKFTTATRINELSNFVVTSTRLDSIYVLAYKDGVAYYYDSGWKVSDETLAQSNVFETFIANIATLITSDEEFTFGLILHSDGSYSVSITEIFSEVGYVPTDTIVIEPATVWSFLYDVCGEGLSSEVSVKLFQPSSYKNKAILPGTTKNIPIHNGYFSIDLLDTENMEEGSHYIFNIYGKIYAKVIPEEYCGVAVNFAILPNFNKGKI